MRVDIRLLGDFALCVDGRECAGALRRSDAARVVKLLAIVPGHRLHREQLVEMLWPDATAEAAANRLYKAAHFVRRATASTDAVVLRSDSVSLFPDTELVVDVEQFEALAGQAIDHGDRRAGRAAVARYHGDVLALDLYEDWAFHVRERVRLRHRELLRWLGEHQALVALDPTDEAARVALMGSLLARRDGPGVLAQFEALRVALERELGVSPGEDAVALRDAALALGPDTARPEVTPSTGHPDAPVHYARSGTLNIAYQVTGGGPLEIVLVPGFVSHLQLDWTEPRHAHFLDRLGRMGRLVRFDKRGTGLSDRPADLPDLEARMDDLRAVMDAAGCERAVVFGYSEGVAMSILFAATSPERCAALVLYGGYAKRIRTPDYPWAPTLAARQAYAEQIERDWAWEADMRLMCPSADEAMARWWGERCRAAASPGAARRLVEMNSLVDVRHVLPNVHVPALVLHRTDDRDSSVEEARYLAERLPAARLVELAGRDHFVAVDPDQILDEVEHFLEHLEPAGIEERTLGTALVAQVDDADALRPSFATAVDRFRGLKATDALVATFDGPSRAVRAAIDIARAAVASGLDVRIGLHAGEVRRGAATVSGPAVDVAAHLAASAGAGHVLASSAVVDLTPGSGLRFESVKDLTVDGRPVLSARH